MMISRFPSVRRDHMSWLFDRRLREKVKAGLIREPEVEES
jgi:hypothetical protein